MSKIYLYSCTEKSIGIDHHFLHYVNLMRILKNIFHECPKKHISQVSKSTILLLGPRIAASENLPNFEERS